MQYSDPLSVATQEFTQSLSLNTPINEYDGFIVGFVRQKPG